MAYDHLFGHRALSGTGGFRQRCRDDEPAAIFHQRVAQEAELGFLAAPFAIRLRIRIGGRGMRGVTGLLAMKIALTVAARTGRIARAILRLKALTLPSRGQ
jgi:hypothetical protein